MKSHFFRWFLFTFIILSPALFSTNATKIQYAVLLSADGPLGTDLDKYWKVIEDSDLNHDAISQYPPHCTITGFFNPKHPASYYFQKIQDAITNVGGIPSVKVRSYPQHDNTLDYLVLTSNLDYLTDVGVEFLSLAHLPATLVKGPIRPKGQKGFTFHITLRDKTFDTELDRLQRIHDLQNQYVHPKDAAGWFIGLYIRENDEKAYLYDKIRIIPVP